LYQADLYWGYEETWGRESNVKKSEYLKVCWDAISEDHMESLIQSMPGRLQAVIDANGDLTPYLCK
jgi:hypothetical protein